jgi:DNA-binding transcriptional LysR family regulator
MDLNRIAVFARVLEEGSFTKAARALSLPKSSVSRSVALLEETLGTRLLHRSSRKVSATEAGATYYAHVARALASIHEANAGAAEENVIATGLVRMTAPFDAGGDVFVPLLARFVEKHPLITVDLVLSGRIVDLVEEGFDLAVRAGPIGDQSLIARKIAEIRFGLFASRAYLKRRGAPTAIAELSSHDAVIFRGTRGHTTWSLTSGGLLESVDVSGRLSVDDMGAVRSAVLAGAGIGLLAPFTCAKDVASGKVVRVLPEWAGAAGLLSLVYSSTRFVPQRVVVLRDYLLTELGRVPWNCSEAPGAAPPRKRAAKPR